VRKNLKRLLANGDTIELKPNQANSSWSFKSNLSEIITDKKLRVKASKHNYPNALKQHHQFILTATKDHGVYQMQATVQEIIEGTTDITLLFDVHTDIEQIQRREYFRLSLLKEMSVNLIGDPPVKGITQNISAGGLKCLINSTIRTGATCEVYLEIEPQPLTLKGRVLECHVMAENPNHTSLRIQFLELKQKEQQLLTAYIFTQQGKREAKVKR
jgi:c-di-GMP-binding flagellar brake protein YcgR